MPAPTTDAEVLARFAATGDEGSFAELVRRLGPMVRGVCRRRLGPGPDADDAFQAVFLVLARKGPSLRSPEGVAAWVYGVANLVGRKVRKARARRAARETAVAVVPDRPGHARHPDPDLGRVLGEELDRLPEKFRLPILLCDLRELTVARAAVELGWAAGTVASRLRGGRTLLADRLRRRGVAPSVAVGALLASGAASAVPRALLTATVRAASEGGAAPAVLLLTEGVLTMTGRNVLRALAFGLLSVVAVGGGLLTAPAADPPTPVRRVKAPVPAKAEPWVVREEVAFQQMAVSPDGRAVATVGVVSRDGKTFDGTVTVRDARTGKVVWAADEETDTHLVIAFSKEYVAVAVNGRLTGQGRGTREVRLLDARTGKVKHTAAEGLVTDAASLTALAFSPDGQRLAVAGIGKSATFLTLWDVEGNKSIDQAVTLDRPRGADNAFGCLAFSPDGTRIAGGCNDGVIRLFDGKSLKEVADLTPGPESKDQDLRYGSSGVTFSADGNTLVSRGFVKGVLRWDLTTEKPDGSLDKIEAGVLTTALSPDGRWLATADDAASQDGQREVKVWDAKTGRLERTVAGVGATVCGLAFTPDGRAVVVCAGHHEDARDGVKSTGELRLERVEK